MDRFIHLKDLESVFNSFSCGINIFDESGIVIINNTVACKMMGIAKEKIEGSFVDEIFSFVSSEVKEVIKSGSKKIGVKATIEDVNYTLNSRPFYSGNNIAFVLNVFQKESCRKNLHKEFDCIEKIIDIVEYERNDSADGFWVNDRNGKVVAINRVSAGRSNIDRETALGMNVDIFLDSGEVDTLVTREVIASKKSVTCIQKIKSGKQLFSTGTPLFDSNGEVDLIVVSEKELPDAQLFPEGFTEKKVLLRHPSEFSDSATPSGFVFQSALIKSVLNTAKQVATVDSTVLIQGESGVGKSLFAKIIHQYSHRNKAPFNRVDCGAIPESLIESELFGYEKGAFTGAKTEGKPGQFEMTEGGTLFLDEIAELSINVQVKLLRFLEEKEVVRVGGGRPKKLNLRIIAATNKSLEKMVAEERFREDLFYRINVVPIKVPPLRERIEDIGPLINFHMQKLNKKYSTDLVMLPETVEFLEKYSFPGNVRELSNRVERLVVLSKSKHISPNDLPAGVLRETLKIKCSSPQDDWNLKSRVAELERDFIIKALRVFKTQRITAKKLGIEQSTLSRKIKRYNIQIEEINN